MASFNKVILVGNVTRDIEVKYTSGGTACCDVGIAVSRKFKGKSGNYEEETTFVDVTLWGRTAEVAAQYATKGKPILIEGRLQLDQWEDKQSGQKRQKLKVVGETLQLLGGKSDGGGSRLDESSQESKEPQWKDVPAGEDDVPF